METPVNEQEQDKEPMVLCPWCRNEGKIGEPICMTCCGDGVIPAKDL